MADVKITALAVLTAADPINDAIPIVDVSDATMAASGTTKRISVNNILSSSPTASGALTVTGLVTAGSATITGDLTVDTSTLKVDSTNNRVGILTASPQYPFHVVGTDTTNVLFAGVTKGVRFTQSASTSLITGVDNTGGASYQPLSIGGSAIDFSLSGTTAMTLNSTGLGVGATPDHKLQAVGGYVASGKLASASSGDIGGLLMYCSTDNGGRRSWGLKAESASTGILGFWVSSANNTEPFSGSQVMSLNASGNLLVARTGAGLDNTSGVTIGQSSIGMQTEGNATQIAMNRTTSDGTIVDIRRNNSTVGTITVTTTATAYNTSSDYRLKEAAKPLVGGLARVNALKPSIYKWKANGSAGEGFLAHELAEVVPFAVTGDKDAVDADGKPTYQGVDMSKLVPILVAAIQELTARVQTLEAR